MSPVSKTPLAENSEKADAHLSDVHSSERIFANSFRLRFPPSSRIRSIGRVMSPRCLFVEQYFHSVSARPFVPHRMIERREDVRRDIIVYSRSNFGHPSVFVDWRSLSVELCYIAEFMSVLFTRLDNGNRSCGFRTSFASNFIRESENRMCLAQKKNIRKEKYLLTNYVKILFQRSLRHFSR